MEDFYKKKDGARELLKKEKIGLFLVWTSFLWEKKRGRVFIIQITSFFTGVGSGEGPCVRLPF